MGGALGGCAGDDGPNRSRAAQCHARKTTDPRRQRLFYCLTGEFPQQAKLLRRHLAVALEKFRQPDRTNGYAPQLRRLIANGAGHLRRSPTDVDAQRPRLGWTPRQHAQAHEASFLLARYSLKHKPGLTLDPPDDIFPVLGLTQGAGADGAHARLVTFANDGIAPQNTDEPIDDCGRNDSGLKEPLSGTDRIALLVHRFDAPVGKTARNFQANGIGPHINGGDQGFGCLWFHPGNSSLSVLG